ncbi:MAG: DNA-processing protein DprA [Nitrospiraceae bacterium]
MSSSNALRAWLSLRALNQVGDATVYRLVQFFGSAESALQASTEALVQAGCAPALIQIIQRGPGAQVNRQIDRELLAIDRLKVRVVTCLDSDYPTRLKTIPDPPPILYVTGQMEKTDDYALAIVGARRATPVGRMVTEELSRHLAALGFTIVSGMARGVDAAAHRGALAAGGRTMAVLGCGVDQTYPPEHKLLRTQIEANGAVLSELPLSSPPHSFHFPRRNRIISGLCLGVVVTEAALQSGSLITARLAADHGREVFAVPGCIKEKHSRGPNGLIKEGAKLVEEARDILDELMPQLDDAFVKRLEIRAAASAAKSSSTLGKEETCVYDSLSYEPLHVDDVIARTRLPTHEVTAVLLALELKGRVKQLPGQYYLRVQ